MQTQLLSDSMSGATTPQTLAKPSACFIQFEDRQLFAIALNCKAELFQVLNAKYSIVLIHTKFAGTCN